MKTNLRLIFLVLLFFLSGPVLAELPASPIAEINQDSLDQSYAVQIFRALFGGVAYYAVLSMPAEGIDSALSNMFMVFNVATFIVLAYLMFMIMMGRLLASGNDGKIMSQRYNDTMAITRGTLSLCGLLPVVSGFCLAQVFVMFVAIQASFIADEVNRVANKWTYTNGSIATYRPDPIKITNLVHSIVESEICASAQNNYYAEHKRYDDRYKVTFVDTTSSMNASGDDAYFRYEYQSPAKDDVCGSVEMIVNQDKYLGSWGDPTGTVEDMSDHQLAIRNKIVNAHKSAVLKTHNYIANSLSAGIVIPGQDIDKEAFAKGLSDAKRYYQQALLDIFLISTDSLNQEWDKQVNSRFQGDALTFSAARGWVYNGFTWLDKSRAESFMSKMAQQAPRVSKPDDLSFESAFYREAYQRTLEVHAELNEYSLENGQENQSTETGNSVIQSTRQLEKMEFDHLANELLKSDNWEAISARVFSSAVNKLLVESQFNFKDYDPITNLQHLGYRMLNTGFSVYFLAVGVDATTTALAAGTDPEKSIWAAAANTVTFGALEGFKAGGLKIAKYFIDAMVSLSAILIAVGTILAYWLPSLPFFMWDLAVLGNYLLVIVAFMAAPLWMAAHAMPEGDGLTGDHARQGWITMITILARPSIMVMTWHVALLLMREMGNFTSLFLNYAPMANSDAITGLWGALAMVIIYLIFETVIAYRCTSLIYEVPDQIPIYYGGNNSTANESIGEGRGQSIVAGWSSHTQATADRSLSGGDKNKGAGGSAGGKGNSPPSEIDH